jgi:hypothetical protein
MEAATTPAGSALAADAAFLSWARRNAGTIIAGAIYAAALGASVSAQFVQDSWLSLAGGRDIARNGLPWHERLTLLTAGARWVDQQWLGKLVLFALSSVGGLRLLAVAHLVCVLGAYSLALVVARRRGVSDLSALIVAVAFLPAAPWGWQLRTQAAAYVLFVAVLAIVTAERIRPLHRVVACAPLLVLWANVHGSATLGACLVACCGLLELRRRHVGAALAGGVIAGACLFASPYTFHLIGYYRSLLGNPAMSHYIQEWQAPTARTATAFFVLAALVLWLVARDARALTWMERAALAITCATGLLAIRGIVWFSLASLMIVPKAVDARWPRVSRVRATHRLVAVGGVWVSAAVVAVALGVAHLPGSLENRYPAAAARVVSTAAGADPSLHVFASEPYADWLLWKDAHLTGRIVYDARFELFAARQFAELSAFRSRTPSASEITRGARLFVLGFRNDRRAIRDLAGAPGAKILYRDNALAVIFRP